MQRRIAQRQRRPGSSVLRAEDRQRRACDHPLWSVADVSAFFESKDAVGLATTFTANAVQGEDLLRFTGDDLVADLRMARFGARKALALRDAFLRG